MCITVQPDSPSREEIKKDLLKNAKEAVDFTYNGIPLIDLTYTELLGLCYKALFMLATQ